MIAIHDHPYAHMDNFHEGEHLTPAYLFANGERPFRDVFLLHGLGVDGGLDALVAGDPPAVVRTRRLQTVLDAVTLALLVPIAAEVTATAAGLLGGVLLSLCGVAAFWLPVFPYFRLAPILLATLMLLRYARTRSSGALFVAFASAALGVLWSLDVGTYTVAAVGICTLFLRPPWKRALVLALIAAALPLVALLTLRADVRQFFVDSYVVIPRAIDAVWSLPAPAPFTAAGLRYYLPPVFYGFVLALAWKRRDPKLAILAVVSVVLFRSAAGRVSWSHTRFAIPLLGIALVGYVLEPLRNRLAMAVLALAAVFYFEVPQNLAAGAKLASEWSARQRHEGLVRHPLAPGIYTTPDNATTLATLKNLVDSLPPGPVFDFTNERALYFMLRRKPPSRVFDVPMLSAPPLLAETLAELEANPPVAVILGGEPVLNTFDGVSNRDRVPELAAWIDARYRTRTEIGRFVVATP
ncbi:MAG TPA: hypothetical protein VEK57_00515 [Thermoanaerobaculia bacterium]|nr:hypothetical protein [Thermoanaerobaculia bacterium]